jgi:undecaprenyl-diphosphatase
MNFIVAVILGVLEGVTEFLPISSTGHLILASRILAIPPSEYVSSFIVCIQLGAILAVTVLYGKELITSKALMLRILVAFLPTALIGFLLYPFLKVSLLGNDTITMAALFAGGIVLVLIDRTATIRRDTKENAASLSYAQAAFIGVTQAVSVVPGVSRAAATIIGGRLIGLGRSEAVRFSFLLAIPTMIAATALDLVKSAASFTAHEFLLLGVGFMVSFVIAVLVIRFFLRFIAYHSLAIFGIYRMFLAVVYWLWAGR